MRKIIMMAYAFLMTNLFVAVAFAEEHGAAGSTDSSVKAALALAAGFGIALA
ncbi:MAG: hypothetical protein HYW85_05120, partial [Deltaproteobacteria bacterium]|nr:hypothetical protein [Deltaproteobacteria bacterium]